ncbi:hypothetical protein Acr_22g0009740 [Actinidia rufa]|uniref:Uncharacterized protein n=1 Tax=Actinidia rufa TaxID=165716 RepID=A0A7J0GL82_9ERIC|nr:hypothetical protein Acr_22g0009740 [Actinidia rufa]
MALNQAQLLVHDDEALARFRANHRIPDDVLIERPSPNNAADWVEGEGNRIPVWTWFIHQVGLREEHEFTAEDLLHVYCIVRPKRNAQTHMYKGFNAHYWRRSERYATTIRVVNNCGCTRKLTDLLGSSLSIEVNDLIKGIATVPPAQVPATKPILVPSSDSEAADPKVAPAAEDIIEHSFNQGGILGYNSKAEEGSITPRQRALGKKKAARDDLAKQIPDLTLALLSPPRDYSGTIFATVDLRKQVTTGNTSKDHKACLALRNAIMLPQDVVDLAAEDSEEFGGRLVMMDAQNTEFPEVKERGLLELEAPRLRAWRMKERINTKSSSSNQIFA